MAKRSPPTAEESGRAVLDRRDEAASYAKQARQAGNLKEARSWDAGVRRLDKLIAEYGLKRYRPACEVRVDKVTAEEMVFLKRLLAWPDGRHIAVGLDLPHAQRLAVVGLVTLAQRCDPPAVYYAELTERGRAWAMLPYEASQPDDGLVN